MLKNILGLKTISHPILIVSYYSLNKQAMCVISAIPHDLFVLLLKQAAGVTLALVCMEAVQQIDERLFHIIYHKYLLRLLNNNILNLG